MFDVLVKTGSLRLIGIFVFPASTDPDVASEFASGTHGNYMHILAKFSYETRTGIRQLRQLNCVLSEEWPLLALIGTMAVAF